MFLSVPVSLVSYIFFYFLYKFLRKHKFRLKSLFKSYSHLYGLVLVLFIQNISRLSFLAFHNFKHLFYFNFKLCFIQAVSVVFIGLVVILSVGFFYKIRYLNEGKGLSLSFNLTKRFRWSLILTFRLVLRPLIEIAINVFLFENYDSMVLSLCGLELFTFLYLSAYQIK